VVGLVVFRGQSGPAGQPRGPVEAGDVADLGDEHRGQHRPDPGDLLDSAVAGVAAQPAGDQLGEQVDLEVQLLDQPQDRLDPRPGLRGQAGRGKQLPTARSEQVTHRHLHAGAGKHPVDLALQVRAQTDQLGPVPYPAAQLAGRRRGDPRLG
jgi:hypothetical protein